MQRQNIHHIHTSAMHPSANGAAERIVQSIKRILAKLVNDHVQHWGLMLPAARQGYVKRVHAATGYSPDQLLFGFQPGVAVAAFALRKTPPAGQSMSVCAGAGRKATGLGWAGLACHEAAVSGVLQQQSGTSGEAECPALGHW